MTSWDERGGRDRRGADCGADGEREVGARARAGGEPPRHHHQCGFHAGLSRPAHHHRAPPPGEEGPAAPRALCRPEHVWVSYSPGRWCVEASAALREAQSAGRLPIVVGGTGLYFKALTHGLAAIPAIPGDVRARVRKRLRE